MNNNDHVRIEIIEIPGALKNHVQKCPICNSTRDIRIYCEHKKFDLLEVYLRCVTCRYVPQNKLDTVISVYEKEFTDHELDIDIKAIDIWNKFL